MYRMTFKICELIADFKPEIWRWRAAVSDLQLKSTSMRDTEEESTTPSQHTEPPKKKKIIF